MEGERECVYCNKFFLLSTTKQHCEGGPSDITAPSFSPPNAPVQGDLDRAGKEGDSSV